MPPPDAVISHPNTPIYYGIAVPSPVHGLFTYASSADIAIGCRVLVPFGKRQQTGVVMLRHEELDANLDLRRVKQIYDILDEKPVFPKDIINLAEWMSSYYCYPLGEVLKTMTPSSGVSSARYKLELTSEGKKERDKRDPSESPLSKVLQIVFGKKQRSKIGLQEALGLLKRESVFSSEAEAYQVLEQLLGSGWVVKRNQGDLSSDAKKHAKIENVGKLGATSPPLREQQKQAVETIWSHFDQTSPDIKPVLLHGVTGSGKTEVYLSLIEKLMNLDPEAQILVLVPEISLTPQMTHVFEKRFPGQVVIVHSAQKKSERSKNLAKIRLADSKILIGPRSTLFASFANLRLIIVDEEHDSSYKQTTGLCYNGRDLAIVRGSLSQIKVILGSATPSIESFFNAISGKYHLLQLSERIAQGGMPAVDMVESLPSYKRAQVFKPGGPTKTEVLTGSTCVNERIIEALKKNFSEGNQSIVLVNRRGAAHFLFVLEDKKALSCPECSVSLTFYSSSGRLKCHYCGFSRHAQEYVRSFPNKTFLKVGYGSEKIESELVNHLPEARVERLDADILSTDRTKLEEILSSFRKGDIHVLVGTQILAKGHDFPNVTLVVILDADEMMMLPDFRAGERFFQLLVQASGRAGRAQKEGHVLIQASRTDHPTILHALRHDYQKFFEAEIAFRRAHSYPPFSRMALIELNSEEEGKLDSFCGKLGEKLGIYMRDNPDYDKNLRVSGPSVPPLEMIRRRYRRVILVSAKNSELLHSFLGKLQLDLQKVPAKIRARIDVDPQSVM